MRLPPMGKASRFLLAIALISVGTAIAARHSEWGRFTGVAVLLMLLAATIAAGVQAVRSRSEDQAAGGRLAGQKISNSLVTLSSAAILAVYAAGYHRTGSAADKFAAQTARRSTALPFAAVVAVTPTETSPRVEAPPAVSPSAVPPVRISHPRSSSTPVPKAEPAPAPPDDSPTTPVSPLEVTTSNDPVAEPATTASPSVTSHRPYKDGTYLGLGSCRHGQIQASVVIQGGQIVSTTIAQCWTRYSCSWIADLPGQVISRQSPNVDYVSGATQSSDAFSDAVDEALHKASE
jgi:uncharacterized protein with FMN-binding domain